MSGTEQSVPCRWGAWWSEGSCARLSREEPRSLSKSPSLTFSISHMPSPHERVAWDQLIGDELSLRSDYLYALSQSSPKSYYWVRFYLRDQLIGICLFTLADFMGPSVRAHLGDRGVLAKALKLVGAGAKPMSGHVLVCGHPSLIGRPAYRFHPSVTHAPEGARLIAESLTHAVEEILARGSQDGSIDAVLFSGDKELNELMNLGYVHFEAEPKLKLSLSPSWRDFKDYLQDLTSKYRVKMKRAYSKSATLTARQLCLKDLEHHHERLRELYRQVNLRASLAFNALEIEALPSLMSSTPHQVSIHAYFLNENLIGFRVSLIDEQQLIALLVGIDYEYSFEHSLYPRILNDYLNEAIERRVTVLDLGRTAGEIKTTLGAVPESSSFYLRHQHPLLKCALPSIANQIELSPFKVHEPFKSSVSHSNAD